MKKLFVLILALTLFAFPTAALANPTEKEPLAPVPFEFVTAEKDDFQPENEYSITFEKKITILAKSLKGAKISLVVSYDSELDIEPAVYATALIGATQKYMQPVSLHLGDNYIELTIEREGYEPVVIEALVKRMDNNIAESLEKLIVIPPFLK